MSKRIGLVCGLGPETTIAYYNGLNELAKSKFGVLNTLPMVLSSLNLAEIANLQEQSRWDEEANIICNSVMSLKKAGADVLALCSNTIHLPQIYDPVQKVVGDTPLIHIVDSVKLSLYEQQHTSVLVLGTKFTMQSRLYDKKLNEYRIQVYYPDHDAIECINTAIFGELCTGQVTDITKDFFRDTISELKSRYHFSAVVLGCTELRLLELEFPNIAIVDSVSCHVNDIFNFACKE